MDELITISEMAETDVEAVHAVLYETWLATYPNKELGITTDHIQKIISPILNQEQIAKRKQFIKEYSETVVSFVAKNEKKVVGVCSGKRISSDEVLLKSLYVLPQFQGKGIGKSLWNEFKKWAQTNNFIVNVATYNEKAIKFYQSLGFVDTGKRFIEDRFTFEDGKTIPQMEMKLIMK